MEFSANNPVVKLCLQGMGMEERAMPEDSGKLFLQAWEGATQDFEKFISAYFLARHQKAVPDKLKWLGTALRIALKMNDDAVKSALPLLYSSIAKCYEDLNDPGQAQKNHELATSFKDTPSDQGPFYHGTRADLRVGDLLTAGGNSNYKQDLKMNHVYFTALMNGAGLAAALAKGDQRERVYIVEPTGPFENDPNVTNQKFPGNMTRSYRSEAPLKIVGEVTDRARLAPAELDQWRKKLAANQGEIIN